MGIKEWETYTDSEKKALLNLWFYYTNPNQEQITEEETITFHKLLDQDVDLIMHLAVCQTMIGQSSEPVVLCMRKGTLNEVLKALPEMTNDQDYNYMKTLVITMLVGFYTSLVDSLTEQKAVTTGTLATKSMEKHYS